jgi:hypothetical protein
MKNTDIDIVHTTRAGIIFFFDMVFWPGELKMRTDAWALGYF